MREPDHIAELVFKYLREELSPEEQEELSAWRAETVTNEALFQKMTDLEEIREMMQAEHYKKKTWA
ncbi:MAG TPA: hypothetical protein VK543_01140, partial [Puia sp.]|nr:hypothetical protein [Puia sp.]